jgi:DNA-directed RNA polymerase specialized sigma24 family protein
MLMQEEDVVRLYKEMAPGITAKLAFWLSKMKIRDNILQLAEDLVEEAFELVLRAARRNQPVGYSEKSFIWYRVRKVWNRFLEKRKKVGYISKELFEEFYQAEDADPCEMLINSEKRLDAFERMTEEQVSVIGLIDQGYKYREFRRLDACQSSAFRTFIHRIRKLFP